MRRLLTHLSRCRPLTHCLSLTSLLSVSRQVAKNTLTKLGMEIAEAADGSDAVAIATTCRTSPALAPRRPEQDLTALLFLTSL